MIIIAFNDTNNKTKLYNYDKYYVKLVQSASSKKTSIQTINAKAYCIVDYRDNHILAAANKNMKLPMASTTKILTTIVALESDKLNDDVTISTNAASQPKVKLGAKAGSIFKLKDLLFSTMLCSHNDSAYAIAEHISGSVEDFAEALNNKAYQIGAYDSSFVTPNGLDDINHYSTASDMCLIASYAMHNDKFVKLINTKSTTINDKNNKTYSINNINKFLSMNKDNIGIKTGFTSNAGCCFVGANKFNDTILVSCVLRCGYPPNNMLKYKESQKLVNYVKKNYKNRRVAIDKNVYDIILKDGKNFEVEADGISFDMLSDYSENIYEICHVDPSDNYETYVMYDNVKQNLKVKK